MMVSPSASSKRARAPSNGSHNISCLVDGCESDLSNCKDYHKRHKVCEVHAKTPKVMVEGQEQRFCQQCSRFHLLVEFDEVKRSCRKRLDGHNRRRRKPQTDSISMNSGTFFSSQQGTGFSSFINTTQIVASTMPGSNWTMAIKSGEDPHPRCDPQLHFIDRQRLIPTDISHGSEGGRQYPILQSGGDGNNPMLSNQKTVGASRCDPVHHTITRSDSSSGKVPADGLTQFIGSTDCALSLLSMPTPASSSGLTHMARADQIPVPQPLVAAGPSMGRYSHSQASSSVSSSGFSCLGVEDQRVATVLASDGSENADLHASRGGPLESGAHQPLPWYD